MVFNTKELLQDLSGMVDKHIEFVNSLESFSEKELQQKKNATSWSVIECLEHLNLYAIFYNTEIKKRIETSKYVKTDTFTSGYLGNKFAIDMLPKKGMKTMQTFKSKNPIYSELNVQEVLCNFKKFQQELLELLKKANTVDLTKTKTAITLPLLKFRLGDTFRFVINHNQRHIEQAKRVVMFIR